MLTGLECLALNIYYEAAVEPLNGWKAVSSVTINRAIKKNKSICAIVTEHKQFSWTLESKKRKKLTSKKEFNKLFKIKLFAEVYTFANYSLFYYINNGKTFYPTLYYFHDHKISPSWKKDYVRKLHVGTHIYYTEKKK